MKLNKPASQPLARERNLILASLLTLAAAAWALLLRRPAAMDVPMGLTPATSAPLFIATWAVMMAAMMFPAAAPMILTFVRVQAGRREQGQAFVPTWIFVGGYMAIWTLFGALAWAAAVGLQTWAGRSMWLMENMARLGGGVLVLAGLYQLTPLKHACLRRCRTPLDFVLHAWRDGHGGAFRMGLEHGLVCLACCWHLSVILFPLGLMNVAAMAAITVLIFAEKSWPVGPRVSRLAAAALVAYGVLAVFVPGALPGFEAM